jgi:hypothetical protein
VKNEASGTQEGENRVNDGGKRSGFQQRAPQEKVCGGKKIEFFYTCVHSCKSEEVEIWSVKKL